MDCYKCIWRKDAIGSAHSVCCFPGTKTGMLDCFMRENLILSEALNIRASSHGINKGWFMWPVNFDPVWLRNCYGFTDKDNVKEYLDKFKNVVQLHKNKSDSKDNDIVEFCIHSFKMAINIIESSNLLNK